MRWKGGEQLFSAEQDARRYEAPGPACIESRVITITLGPWEDIDEVRFYWRQGKVHLLSPDTGRFLCGVKNGPDFMRLPRAAPNQICQSCVKRAT